MRQFLKFIVALCVATLILTAIRTFAFTVYTAPVSIGNHPMAGQKVMVNKLCRHDDFRRGDLIVFTVSGEAPAFSLVGPPQELGRVVALPGDTINVKGLRYRIPKKCCNRCQCDDCRLYLVDTGVSRLLVHKHQVTGRAY